jgi:murein DD-endopeptidase MepM/ murein hydrolase activator NlpD
MRLPSPAKATLIASAAMVALVLWLDRAPEEIPVEAMTGFQDADAPLFMPDDGKARLHSLSAWELARVPTALRWDAPLGSEQGALTWMDPATGDLNGIGGSNGDLGDPVFAVADGLVIFAGEPSALAGKTLVLAHRTKDGRLIQSVYGGLETAVPAIGDLVPHGTRIGSVGTARGHRAASLHFEMRTGDGLAFGAGAGDPVKLLGELAGRAEADLAPSPLGTALKPGE